MRAGVLRDRGFDRAVEWKEEAMIVRLGSNDKMRALDPATTTATVLPAAMTSGQLLFTSVASGLLVWLITRWLDGRLSR